MQEAWQPIEVTLHCLQQVSLRSHFVDKRRLNSLEVDMDRMTQLLIIS